MNHSDIKYPTNKSFGFFFTAFFWIGSIFSYYVNNKEWFFILGIIGLAFLIISTLKSDALFPINKLWMKFGLLLGMIISPALLGIIFFGIFTPIAVLMRLFGRDELKLQFKKKVTYWVSREEDSEAKTFKNQF